MELDQTANYTAVNLNNMTKEELVNTICKLIIKRDDESFRMISKSIDKYFKALNNSTNKTHPYIWGDGWYAIPDIDYKNWSLAPIKFFDEKGYCPDGWEWEKPEGLSNDELDDFIDEHGCEPEIPSPFAYCMESTIECRKKISKQEQKQILKEFGYTVDNIPKWYYERNE